ncbi:glycoside hydrolase family 16 protein [Carboxylicivirga linearis]|uniref:Family 16 glycosylhydrolase n=1 Tax=Carboxylicivirga linearis TaxID=1628157 RepID=A0ABS5K0G9_9BACT|nr:glycoside hydrolase family 16 protein [Carboxylicivirga linearis]MBS2100580.1 family 16 glycosylhydrolase [Carboxylicivirga linearis]
MIKTNSAYKKLFFKTSIFLLAASILSGCEKEENTPSYQPDFEYSEHTTLGNTLVFENTSEGEYYYVRWIFGNGERTDRMPVSEGQNMEVFYPEKGDYKVEMTIWGSQSDLAENKTISKTITINEDVFTASFNVQLKPGAENVAVLTNTTEGSYDHVSWKVEGEEIADNGDEVEVYMPLAGKYGISMEIGQGEYTAAVEQSFTIAQDDPEYFNQFKLVWSDEFDGTLVDDSKWVHETGMHGWGNNEWQNYTSGDNSTVENGLLSITAKLIGEGQQVGDYTSSRMNSIEDFTYGKFEIRAKMPEDKGPGIWPAIWMLGRSIQNGTSWPLCGELDIMEYVSFDPNHVSCSIHTESNNHAAGNPIGSGHVALETAEEEFHVYGLLWTERWLKFYRDDVDNVFLTYNRPNEYNKQNWPFDDPFYILLNVAVGGNYGGVQGVDDNIFPATMEIDYVRVYQYSEE